MQKPTRQDPSNDPPAEFWESTSSGFTEQGSTEQSPTESLNLSVASSGSPELQALRMRHLSRYLPAPVPISLRDSAPATDTAALPRDVLLALTYGLELLRGGAMLVRIEGSPYFLNRAAADILKQGDGLALARNGLVADRPSDTRLLHQLLHEAITAPELGEPKGSPLRLPRRKAQTALIVRVLPGPGLDCWRDKENRAALLTVCDEDTNLKVDESVLCKLYGLTRGEAALASILLRGKSIEEAAAELFISPHTARTHLKRIFMKTDTHRQTELVVRIVSAVL
jgi:DNA-binding CsgD family transcriptional regulator